MPGFEFQTVDASGRRSRGREHAADVPALVRALEARGLVPVDVREADRDERAALPARAARAAEAMRALASLLDAGLPLVRALEVTASSAPDPLASVLRDIRARVERGEGVAAACAAHPGAFSAAAIGVIRAGERSGDLVGAFDRLATQLERAGELRARLLSAAIYPAVLAVAGGAAILVLLLFVLPRFAALLEGTGIPLPPSAAILLGISTALRAHWMVLPVVAAALLAVAAWLRGTAQGRLAWASALLGAPLVRAVRRDALATECASTLAVLLRGGTPIAAALDDAARAASDPLLTDALQAARRRVVSGSTLRDALAPEPIFGEVFITLVATGEEAGRLTEFLERAATMFERRTERTTKRLVALAEPVMIVIFGVLVGGIALALLQAIYGLNPAGLR